MHPACRRFRSIALLAGLLSLSASGLPAQDKVARPDDKTSLDARVKEALARARPALRQHLRAARGGPLALTCLAAVHDGMTTKDKVFRSALSRMKKAKLTGSYELALRLMVMASQQDQRKRSKLVARDARRLLGNQGRPGGFSYNTSSRWWDLSNTQYAVLGLRAAAGMGFKVKKKHWENIARTAITAQGEDGGFGYTTARAKARGRTSYSSMTAAGIAILQICRQNLDEKTIGSLDLQLRLEKAWDWMTEHKADIGNEVVANCGYFHYGLERACILSDKLKVGDKDWYAAGAEMLLKMQQRNGGWRTNDYRGNKSAGRGIGSPVSTSFAILFLRRKFQKRVGPITPGGSIRIISLGPQATKKKVDAAVKAEVLIGKKAVPGLLKSLRSPVDVRRKAAVQALIRITGLDFGLNPHAGPEQNAEAIKRAEHWWLKNRSGG